MHAVQHLRKINEALAALKGGSFLCREFRPGFECYWLEPNGCGIPLEVAQWLLTDPRVKASTDGIFSNVPQTWRYVDEEVGLHQRMATADEAASPALGAAKGTGSTSL